MTDWPQVCEKGFRIWRSSQEVYHHLHLVSAATILQNCASISQTSINVPRVFPKNCREHITGVDLGTFIVCQLLLVPGLNVKLGVLTLDTCTAPQLLSVPAYMLALDRNLQGGPCQGSGSS